ncbi:TPA: hypothetical protein HA273_02380 [Candidatus Bathyarchaeota archaeon]|nr:hypothetical protein [Candidatus Bathyarchaeota archaeon]HIJ09090.1 hypothetical protein [Candidatus Bathyarchaeota archaeon]
MKLEHSKRLTIIFLGVVLVLAAVNTYLIFENIRIARDQLADDSIFDYVIFRDEGIYKAKNQSSGRVDFSSSAASVVLSQSISKGDSIFIKSGIYILDADVQIVNKKHAEVASNGATIVGNGKKIIFRGDDYTYSQNNVLYGLQVLNATLRIENSFLTSLSDIIFENCSVAIELANTRTWTEGTKIENCHFINCTESIAFRTPTENATGSYASTQINRCFFNLRDNSIGINIEEKAEYSDSQLQNSRMWLGENHQENNQTGLKLDGSMHETLLSGVVFESFAINPLNVYAISIGETSVTTPNIDSTVSFLGNWTSRVYNPFSKWISGAGGVFRNINELVPLGVEGVYGNTTSIHRRPLTIFAFRPRIQIEGTFATNEIVTVRMRLELVDNVISESVEKVFTNTTTLWLSDDDLLKLYPSQDVVWEILVDAKSSGSSTNVMVKIDIYGATT